MPVRGAGGRASRYRHGSTATSHAPPKETEMARKKQPPVADEDRRVLGGLLRELRRAAGYRSVERASDTRGCPAARQTIYAYERGGLVPSLKQFLELVEFYVLNGPPNEGGKPEADLRAQGVAAVVRALSLPAYHVSEAMELVARMQPAAGRHGARSSPR
jgi:hypothetical protein